MKKSPAALLTATVAVSIALVASACGGPSTPGVASLTGKAANTSHQSTSGTGTSGIPKKSVRLDFAKCMRKHGVKDFPEGTGPIKIGSGSNLDPNSPTFKAAQQACQSLLPKPSAAQIQKIKAKALEYAKCMRKHGVKDFPDPTISTGGGGIAIKIGVKSGIDPNSPTFRAAQEACGSIMGPSKGGPGPKG